MNYWWVNQNQTYEHEMKGGYVGITVAACCVEMAGWV